MKRSRFSFFEKLSLRALQFTGSTAAFITASLIIIVWALSGFLFDFSQPWQIFINTFTTIATFLMVFLIQRMQNKDSKAIHLKLNELVASLKEPSNRLIDVEDLTEEELEILSLYYRKLADMAKKEKSLHISHTIEEAIEKHEEKKPPRRKRHHRHRHVRSHARSRVYYGQLRATRSDRKSNVVPE